MPLVLGEQGTNHGASRAPPARLSAWRAPPAAHPDAPGTSAGALGGHGPSLPVLLR